MNKSIRLCAITLGFIMVLSFVSNYGRTAHRQVSTEPVKTVYLTFDDVPTAYTGEILDMLKEHDAKATFFLLEVYMEKYPDDILRILEEGHGIGLHGVTHRAEKIYATQEAPLLEMQKCAEALEEIVGVKSRIVRMPYGSTPRLSRTQAQKLEEAGYKIWDWNVDTKDANGANVSPDIVAQNAIDGIKKNNTSVILMHNMRASLEALPKILNYIDKNNVQMKIIKEDIEPINQMKK